MLLMEMMSLTDEHNTSERHNMSKDQLEMEIDVLHKRLRESQIRLEESDRKVLACARVKDTHFTKLVSELMFIEGCLKKDQKEVKDKLNQRDSRISELEKTVKNQKRQIDALNKANEKLLSSLHGIQLESPVNSPTPSPIPSPVASPLPELHIEEPQQNDSDTISLLIPLNSAQHTLVARTPVHRSSTVELKSVPNSPILPQNEDEMQHQPHRVRFQDQEKQLHAPKQQDNYLSVDISDLRIRKRSLPAYRLVSEDDDRIEFF